MSSKPVFNAEKGESVQDPLWEPGKEFMNASNLAAFVQFVEQRHPELDFGLPGPDCYRKLHAWSVAPETAEDFLVDAADFTGIKWDRGNTVIEKTDTPPYVRFFPGTKINYAENMLRYWIENPDETAIFYRHQDGEATTVTGRELTEDVSRWEQVLRTQGIEKGECVAVNMPYTPDFVAIQMAAANIGAPLVMGGTELKLDAIVTRFEQAQPKLLIAPDGFKLKDKHIDYRHIDTPDKTDIKSLQERLPSIETTLVLPYTDGKTANLEGLDNAQDAYALLSTVQPESLCFERHDFDHPLYYLFSSGSTGVPKGFIHSQGRMTHRHMVEHQLNFDMGPGNRYFQRTLISWMMAPYHVSALGSGTAIMIADGKTEYPHPEVQLDFAAEHGCTHYGTAASNIRYFASHGVDRTQGRDLSALKALIYTGGALNEAGFRYADRYICSGKPIWSASGGTDGCVVFVGGNPFMPVYAGQIVGPMLGTAVECWNKKGKPTDLGERGELVITRPWISMPVAFLHDPGGERYHKAYFETFERASDRPVWAHEDAMSETQEGGLVIYGRVGMTHNKHELRSDPYDIYKVIESSGWGDQIREKASINYFHPQTSENLIILCVALKDGGGEVPQDLQEKIKEEVRKKVGGHAVPDHIFAVPAVPKTPSGKTIEVPLAKIFRGEDIGDWDLYSGARHDGSEIGGEDLIGLYQNIGRKLEAQYAPAPEAEPDTTEPQGSG